MLTVFQSRQTQDCNGISRRDFVTAGALGLGGLLLPDLLRARAESKASRDRSVVFLFLSGGPAHLETFDPKPGNPKEFRSTVGACKTNVPGIDIGGLLPKMAKHGEKLAVVRSLSHTEAPHVSAIHWVMTGYPHPPAENGAAPIRPGCGSILARHRGAAHPKTGLPNFVCTEHIYGQGAAWLGTQFNPFHIRDNGIGNMRLRVGMEQLTDRRSLLKSFDAMNRDVDRSGLAAGMDGFHTQAIDLLRGRAREAFDLNREDPRTRDRYGPGLGQQMLLARRLCEAGVGYVTVWNGGWDSHGTNPSVGHGTVEQEMHKLCPPLDHAVAAFLEDFTAPRAQQGSAAGHHRRIWTNPVARPEVGRPGSLAAALPPRAGRRRPESRPTRRRVRCARRRAEVAAHLTARPHGHPVPRPRHPAQTCSTPTPAAGPSP